MKKTITILDNLNYDMLDFLSKSKIIFKEISNNYPELAKHFILRLYNHGNSYHDVAVINQPDYFFYYNDNDYSYTLISKKENYKTYTFANKFFDIFSISFDSGECFDLNLDKNVIDNQTFFIQNFFVPGGYIQYSICHDEKNLKDIYLLDSSLNNINGISAIEIIDEKYHVKLIQNTAIKTLIFNSNKQLEKAILSRYVLFKDVDIEITVSNALQLHDKIKEEVYLYELTHDYTIEIPSIDYIKTAIDMFEYIYNNNFFKITDMEEKASNIIKKIYQINQYITVNTILKKSHKSNKVDLFFKHDQEHPEFLKAGLLDEIKKIEQQLEKIKNT